MPNQQHLRLEDSHALPGHILKEDNLHLVIKLRSVEIFVVTAPQVGGNAKIQNKQDIPNQHVGQQLGDGRVLLDDCIQK